MSLEPQQFAFGEFVLDTDEKVLLRNGEPVPITPKAFQLLLKLVENRGHLVEKSVLMDSVWAGSFVEESNLTFTMRQLRKFLGDDKQHPRFIETVPRRGYRFIAPISNGEHGASLLETSPNSQARTGISARFFTRPVFYSTALLIAVAIVVAAGLVAFRDRAMFETDRGGDAQFRDLRFDEVARFDKFSSASISPDGKFAAYINTVNGRQSLWLRQLGTGQSNQIVPAEDGVRIALIEFADDGEYIYFSRRSESQPAHVDRVPVFGGVIDTNIVTGIDTEFSVSPDQSLLSFHRSRDGKTSLICANTNQNDSRTLYETEQSITGNTFSPDGRMIAFAAGDIGPGNRSFGVYTISSEGGAVSEVTSEKWNYVRDVVWLTDGRGILITAQTSNNSPRQLWKIDMSDGRTRKITDTQDNLSYISVTKDLRHILISKNSLSSKLYLAPVDDTDSAKSVATAYLGVSWCPDGDVVYSSSNGNDDIWRISSDGSNQRQLTTNSSMDFSPNVSPDGRYIVFLSDRAGKLNLWRMNADGTEQLQLTHGKGEESPSIAYDGTQVIYRSVEGEKIWWRIPITGGDPSQVPLDGIDKIAPSPNGSLLAHYTGKELEKKIILRSAQSMEVIREIGLPSGYFAGHELVWSPDGQSLNYVALGKASASNIWRQPIDGSQPKQLTSFISEGIFYFDFSPDGSKLAFIRGSWSFDIELATAP